ncbi:MAG: acyl-CoA dehydrogenase [Bacillati bacterium ANGP1]|uniref:Acyl-CoA dehydrogenase n=1 Tax=Candidatus Segetimicrobium genomatis TaxID=2569760 RepID=A0A537JVB3_9BACT|nr:MAG: acyl-CoA dehydrogenase [Terrabacteria group bacterium ANGP1]
MEFELSEEHRLVQRTVRDWATARLLPLAAEMDRSSRYPPELIRELGDLGLMGVFIPEEYGGGGMDTISYCIIMEEIARAEAAISAVLSVNNSLVCYPIFAFGDDRQKRHYLPDLARGRRIGCYCLTEPTAGSDAGSLAATARDAGDHWVLNGTKIFVTNGVEANVLIVYARTEADPGSRGISALIAEKGDPGLSVGKVEHKLGIRASSTCEIVLDECRIPKDRLLGQRGKGFHVALATLDGGRIGIAAQALGIARAAMEDATAYAKERRQFGRPIAAFQATQWKIADMATRIQAGRLLAYRAAWLRDQGRRHTREASMAKLFASETAMWAATQAVQIFGGYGYIQEYPVERHFRDAKITEIYEGTSEVQRMVIARQIMGAS